MTTQDDTHAPAPDGDEIITFEEAVSPFPSEDAPPLFIEAVPLPPPFEGAPEVTSLESAPPEPSVESAPPLLLESVPTPFLEATPLPPSPPRPAETNEPARRVNAAAPDPFAVGVRLLRMAPAWLLLTTFGCAMIVLLLGWLKAGGEVSAVTLPSKQNDARAVKATPKANATSPKTAAANSPEAATPPADDAARVAVASNPNTEPAAPAAQAPAPAPAAAEQPAPAAPQAAEKPQAEQPAPPPVAGARFTVQVGSYNNQSEANAHVSRLRAAGFESRSAAVELPGRGTWYRVQVGRFAERAEASKAVTQLRSKGAADGAIVAPLQD